MQRTSSVDTVVARAQQEVAARREAALTAAWNGPWLKIVLGTLLLGVPLILLAPGTLPTKLLLLMGGVCGLRPTHSYFAGGVQLPMEARMVGIFAGFALTLIPLLLLGRAGARRLGSPTTVLLLGFFFASMVFDGVNSTLYEFALPHLYRPSNPLRLITGLLSGIAVAPLLLWFLSIVSLPRMQEDTHCVVGAILEPILILIPVGLLAMLIISEKAVAYAPAAILSIGGIVLLLALFILALLIYSSPLRERVTRRHLLIAPGSLALLLAFAVLGVSAYIRWSNAV